MGGIHNPEAARRYCDQSRAVQLAQVLVTAVAYEKPADPVAYMVDVLKQIKEARESGNPPWICFTRDDAVTMFRTFDQFGKGTITRAQLEEGLRNFGVDPALTAGVLGEAQSATEEEFVTFVGTGLTQTLFGAR